MRQVIICKGSPAGKHKVRQGGCEINESRQIDSGDSSEALFIAQTHQQVKERDGGRFAAPELVQWTKRQRLVVFLDGTCPPAVFICLSGCLFF